MKGWDYNLLEQTPPLCGPIANCYLKWRAISQGDEEWEGSKGEKSSWYVQRSGGTEFVALSNGGLKQIRRT